MRFLLGSRWRIGAVVAVVVALVATVSLALVLNDASDGSADAVDCSELLAESFDEASPKAKACGEDVEVTAERTPWETTWATPAGTTRLDITTVASRTNVSGTWAEIDTTIEGTPGEGFLEVASPVYPIELNAGGEAGKGAPLGSIVNDGKRLDVWFPTELPVPEVDGSEVSYGLAAGVRLVVSVSGDGTGFLPVVELENPAAAERFRALIDGTRTTGAPGDLVLSTAMSDGLRLVSEEGGDILVIDEADEVAFMSPQPVMWDSAGGTLELPETITEVGTGDRVNAPANGDTIRAMETTVDGSRIVVTPDQEMLASSDTVWPVYIDPGFSGKLATEWLAVRTGGYTGTLYKWGDISSTMLGQGDGYCTAVASCNVVFKQRLVWEYSGMSTIAAVAGKDIVSATFSANGVHSYSCTATTTDLYMLPAVSSASTWGSIAWDSSNLMSSRTDYHSSSCGNTGRKSWDAKRAVQLFADNNWTTLSLGLKARDETTMTGWKRFRADATLSVEYNRPPNKPSSMQYADPAITTCVTGTARPVINTTTPRFSAIVSDPDGTSVSAHFQVYTKTSTTETEVWNSTTLAAQASGTRAYARVAAGKLASGKTYFWRVTSTDGKLWSGWGASCEFAVDTSIPALPTITPVTSGTGIEAVYRADELSGGVGMLGKFTLGTGGSSDVVKYSYSFGDPTKMTTVTVTKGATYDVSFDPTSSNAVTLYVKTTDAAGNASPIAEYRIKVASPIEDVIWKLDEGDGEIAASSGPKDGQSPLQVTGASWADGPHQLFGSRDDDRSLLLDGVDDAATGDGPLLDASKSFTVSAHVLLDDSKLGQGDFTALSQDGLTQSGFRLGYRSNCDGNGNDCWSFGMPDSSGGSTVAYANSGVDVRGGEWVHLVGEHDATTKTVRVWACEVGTPDRLTAGEPISSAAVTRGGTAWQSPGAFALGRGQAAGDAANWWPGQIDNVRVFSGQITDASKLRRLCQGAEAEDFGQGTTAFNAVDPTVSEQ